MRERMGVSGALRIPCRTSPMPSPPHPANPPSTSSLYVLYLTQPNRHTTPTAHRPPPYRPTAHRSPPTAHRPPSHRPPQSPGLYDVSQMRKPTPSPYFLWIGSYESAIMLWSDFVANADDLTQASFPGYEHAI